MERLHLDLFGPAHDLRQLVIELPDQPFAGRGTERLFQPDGHLGRDAGPGIQQIAEGLPIHAKDAGGVGHAQPILFNAILPDGRSWVHRLQFSLALLSSIAYSDNRHSTSGAEYADKIATSSCPI